MDIKNTATKEESLQTGFDTSLDLSANNPNTATEEYLKYLEQRSKEVSEQELFEEIYRTQQEHGTEMMRRRAMRREYAERNGVREAEPSFFDTVDKEQALYDLRAKEDTSRMMELLAKRKKTFNKGS